MSPRTEEQFKAIREEKKQKIRVVALELFSEQGYYGTSISKIAKRANISKGLIYNYFSGKEEIVRDIIDNGIHKMLDDLDLNKDGVLETEEIEQYIHKIFAILKENPKFWKLYFSISLQPHIFDLVKEKVDELTQYVFSLFTDYFERKGVNEPGAEAMLFAALLDGIGFHFIMAPEEYPVEKIKDILIKRYVKS
ncbi:MAG: TetR/AcrR family transcriptional regulator [Bacteroidales bacterium]